MLKVKMSRDKLNQWPSEVIYSTKDPLKILCDQQPNTDLQFSEPPARGVLAQDEDELIIFKIQLLGAGRGVSSEHLGDLCAHKRHKCNLRVQQIAKPGISVFMRKSQMVTVVSLPGFFFPDMLEVWKNTKASSLQTCRRTKNTEWEQKNRKTFQHNAVHHKLYVSICWVVLHQPL